MAEAQVVPREPKKVSPVKSVTEETSFAFLKEAIEPKQKVFEAWEDSFNFRKKRYLNENLGLIYEELPCLRQSFGIELVCFY